ncbi:hypothetical protein Tco_1037520 [Tanacetum coccineum]
MMEPTSQGSARPADDEVQQKQAPSEAVADTEKMIVMSFTESSRLSRLSPNNKDPESEPDDNSSSMSSSDSEAELEGCLDLMQLATRVFGCCCNLQQGCLDVAATCSRGIETISEDAGVKNEVLDPGGEKRKRIQKIGSKVAEEWKMWEIRVFSVAPITTTCIEGTYDPMYRGYRGFKVSELAALVVIG